MSTQRHDRPENDLAAPYYPAEGSSPAPTRQKRPARTARALGALGAALILSGSLAACGNSTTGGNADNQAATSSAPLADTTTTASAQSSASDTAKSPSPTLGSPANSSAQPNSNGNAPAPRNPGSSSHLDNTTVDFCTTSDLSVTADQPRGAAGSSLFDVVFTNSSQTTCKMRGYPGISMVTGGDGTQLGEPAERETNQDVATVTLKPGQTAYSAVRLTRTGPIDPSVCTPRQGDGLRVYPPEDTKAAFVRMDNVRGCEGSATYMYVQPIRADR